MHCPATRSSRVRAAWSPLSIVRAAGLGTLVAVAAVQVPAQPLPAPGVVQQQNQIERQLQERLREEQDRALQQRAPQPGADLQQVTPPVAVPDLGAACHPVAELQIEGGPHLGADARAAATREFVGRCLGAPELEALLGVLTRDYIERGFVTTRIYLPPQDLRSGVLRLTVVEGTIERYELAQQGHPRESAWLRGAFPAAPGELLNLRDLEQGLDQLNTLQSNRATLDLRTRAARLHGSLSVRSSNGTCVELRRPTLVSASSSSSRAGLPTLMPA